MLEPTGVELVCLVEPHVSVRHHLAELLEQEGYCVTASFGTFTDARRGIPIRNPRLAIVETRLPDGSGIDLCQELRNICPDVIFVLYSFTLSDEEQQRALEAGFAALVLKSLDLEELFRTIRKVGGSR